jgi:hypothetical protein
MEDNGYRSTCYFCDMGWGSCVCEFAVDRQDMGELPFATKYFVWKGFSIGTPNVDETGRFMVDPNTYYGAPFTLWWEISGRRLYRTKTCGVCGLPKSSCREAGVPRVES